MSALKPTFTLDTNCIIAVDERRVDAAHVLSLAAAHQDDRASVAIVAISASERQKGGDIENFVMFQERVSALGLGELEILPAMLYWNISFWDRCIWAGEDDEQLEREIHRILFPNIEFRWPDFCRDQGLDPTAEHFHPAWRNAKCDVQAMWAHIHHHREVFVTSDRNFHKAAKVKALKLLGVGTIADPKDADQLIGR